MREITTKVYSFNELTEEAKAKAIEDQREEMMESESYDATLWALDDCALFEPSHSEMCEILGSEYYEENRSTDGYGQFVFKNNRKGIFFDEETIQIAQALEITNDQMFFKWLGLPEKYHADAKYMIYDTKFGTVLELDLGFKGAGDYEDIASAIEVHAEQKFASQMAKILQRAKDGYEDYFSDDNVEERLLEFEFEEDGTFFKL